MITPHTLDLMGWGTWGRGRLRLDEPGITFVRGRNMDANGNPNGAGKSSLFNALYAVLHDDHHLAVNKREVRRITRDDTRIRVCADMHGREVVVDQRARDLAVTVDGRAVRARERDGERAALRRLIGISPELWSSTVHVNGVASNPLVRGTSRARCEFLERAFDLNRWVHRHQNMNDVLAGMRRARSDADQVRADLDRLPAPEKRDVERDARVARRTLDTIEQRLRESGEMLAVARSLPPRPPHGARHYRDRVEQLERALRAAREFTERDREYQRARSARDDLARRLRDVPDHAPETERAEDLARRGARLEAALEEARAIHAARPRIERWHRAAMAVARHHRIRFGSRDELLSLSRAWSANLREGSTSCPVCGGALRGAVDARAMRELHDALDDLPRTLPAMNAEVPNIEQLEHALCRVRDRERDLRRRDADRAERAAILAALRAAPSPRPPAGRNADVTDLQRRLERARSSAYAAEQWERVRAHPGNQGELEARVRDLTARARRVRDHAADLERRSTERRAVEAERERLTTRLGDLETELQMHPIYRSLQQAYSPTGMRLWLLQELLEQLLSALNDLVRGQRDRIEFGYRLGRNRDLSIVASNLSGTFDVRMLCGAEGNMFCLSLLTALLPMLPSSRRCSLLVLDELDANCSPATREIIARDYLPRLARVCTTLMVVTPYGRADFDCRHARQLIVEKRDCVSSVVRD